MKNVGHNLVVEFRFDTAKNQLFEVYLGDFDEVMNQVSAAIGSGRHVLGVVGGSHPVHDVLAHADLHWEEVHARHARRVAEDDG